MISNEQKSHKTDQEPARQTSSVDKSLHAKPRKSKRDKVVIRIEKIPKHILQKLEKLERNRAGESAQGITCIIIYLTLFLFLQLIKKTKIMKPMITCLGLT
jgi:hypothetical protein